MRLPSKLTILLALALVGGGWVWWQRELAQARRMGAISEQIKILALARAKSDTVYQDSVAVLTKWKVRWKTATAIDTLTDTLWRDRPDWGRRVQQIIATGDSMLGACEAALRSGDRRCATRDSLLKLEGELAAARGKGHGILLDLGIGALSGTAGYALGRASCPNKP